MLLKFPCVPRTTRNYLIMAVNTNSPARQEIEANLVLRSLADGSEKVLRKNVQISCHVFFRKEEILTAD